MAARTMPGDDVSFEELVARQISRGGTQPSTTAPVAKKPFLKKGSRGWWKDNNHARKKPYVLTSGGQEFVVATGANAPERTQEREQVSPPQATRHRVPSPKAINVASHMSFDESVDLMQSYDWKAQQEANELEEFEYLEQAMLAQSQPVNHALDSITNSSNDNDDYAQSPRVQKGEMPRIRTSFKENYDDRTPMRASYDTMPRLESNFFDDYEPGTLQGFTPAPDFLRGSSSPWENELNASQDDSLQFDEWRKGILQESDEKELEFSSVHIPAKPASLQFGSLDMSELSIADSEPWEVESLPPQQPAPESNAADTITPTIDSSPSSLVQQIFHQPPPPPKPAPPSSSLHTLKMKLQQKAIPKVKATKAAPPKAPPKKKAETTIAPAPAPVTPRKIEKPASIIPSVIDDKIAELEKEVKHYKQETLKLQKRREALDAEHRKFEVAKQEWLNEKKKAQEEIDAEWKQIRKEKRNLDSTLKMGVGLLPDRKERSEVEALKAQIVKMKMDEKTKATKQKASMDFFRQRIAELEVRNQELRDELKFMEQERLANWNWSKFENSTRPIPKAPEEPKSSSKLYDPHLYQEGDSLHQGESFEADWQSNSRDQEKSWSQSNESSRINYDVSGIVPPPPKSPPTTPPQSAKQDTKESVVMQTEQELKAEEQFVEIQHPKGKRERRYSQGPIAKTFYFANGTEKDIFVDGHTIVRFTNGDIKETYSSKTVYYYAAAQTKHTTFADNTQLFEFPNNQIEKHYANGIKEITFVDGTTKRIEVNGDELSVFPDGTQMLEKKNGFREVRNPDGTKARDYPDGRTTWVTANGVEVQNR